MRLLRQWLGLAAIVLLLAACTRNATPTEVTQEAATPTIALTETDAPSEDYCVACHTDKAQLQLLAKPEEATEEESEGAG
jgi:mono/diheme cytochrome c family protein